MPSFVGYMFQKTSGLYPKPGTTLATLMQSLLLNIHFYNDRNSLQGRIEARSRHSNLGTEFVATPDGTPSSYLGIESDGSLIFGFNQSVPYASWVHSNGVRTVIVERLDRLARDLMVQESIVGDLRKNGFELLSVAEPDLMASDPTRILVRQMMGAVAEYEKSQIVLKLRDARMRKKAKTGRCEGRKPFGFFEGEPAVVERIKELRAEGLGFDRIAVKLNQECVPSRTGRPWHGVVINRIVTGKRG